MTDASSPEPKLFISYSWSSPDHEAWVVTFAEELVSQGIDVILDKWDLQPGHDAHAFMESMVADPTVNKVILICDEKYAKKSNDRSGGAGTEAQIITPEIYAKKAQDKFAAVVRERSGDGKPYLPIYYGGRIYFDLTNPSTYGEEFDRILRWVWNQPLHVRPAKGERPSFLTATAGSGRIASSVSFRRSFDAIRNGAPNAVAATNEYLTLIAAGLETFRISIDNHNRETFDDLVVANIEEFTPYRNEIIEIFSTISQYNISDEMTDILHKFFEKLIPYLNRPENSTGYSDVDFENYHFIVHELFLYCIGIFLKFERFAQASVFIDEEYYWMDVNNKSNKMHSYLIFRTFLRIFEHRNKRLGLRRTSIRADMLNERNKGTGIDFSFLMTADFILYLRSQSSDVWDMWWPETLLYIYRFGGPFEMFARAKSRRYFEKITNILQIKDKDGLVSLLAKIRSEPDRIPKWQYEKMNPEALTGIDLIATTP